MLRLQLVLRGRKRWLLCAVAGGIVILISILLLFRMAFESPPLHQAAVLSKVSLDSFPSARCLDGSPGAYYVRKAVGGQDRSWVFVLEGGSFCESSDACKKRSLTDLGSSLHYPDLWNLEEPYLSQFSVDNPLLYNWNVAYARSCDGAYFAGTAGEVTVGEDVLYYSGEHVLRAVVDDLASRDANFKQAAEVLVAGASAGGIAVLAQLDAIKTILEERLNPDVQVYGFADSGFYLSKAEYVDAKRFAVEEQRAGPLFPEACRSFYKGEEWKCLVAANGYAYLQTPVFIWQSRYDADEMSVEMGSVCRKDSACVENYGHELQEKIVASLEATPLSGAFVDGCVHHCWGGYETDHDRWIPYRNPVPFKVHGFTPVQALQKWYLQLTHAKKLSLHLRKPVEQPRVIVQPGKYPCEDCCAGWGP